MICVCGVGMSLLESCKTEATAHKSSYSYTCLLLLPERPWTPGASEAGSIRSLQPAPLPAFIRQTSDLGSHTIHEREKIIHNKNSHIQTKINCIHHQKYDIDLNPNKTFPNLIWNHRSWFTPTLIMPYLLGLLGLKNLIKRFRAGSNDPFWRLEECNKYSGPR